MGVPDYQSLMLPLLRSLGDGEDHDVSSVREQLARDLHVSDEERNLPLPSGKQPVFDNRVGWAKTYLEKAGLVTSPRRGVYRITPEGRALLAQRPERVDRQLLMRYPQFQAFIDERYGGEGEAGEVVPVSAEPPFPGTPEEVLAAAYQQVRKRLETDLLAAVMKASPAFFERLVVELLVRMGYGGSLEDAGKALGRSHDDGVDGVIKEDHLGLDVVYVQAKRWSRTVGRPEIQAFTGSLEGLRARKGVFLTTSSFSSEAREYVSRIEKRVALIDGTQLASLMIDVDVGVARVNSYDIKRVDTDYFLEE